MTHNLDMDEGWYDGTCIFCHEFLVEEAPDLPWVTETYCGNDACPNFLKEIE